MIDVVELFAGVGGFRLGLERNEGFNVLWGNQWEPSHKTQHAFNCYDKHFEDEGVHSNEDIAIAKYKIPKHDLLVGGFPCQDYSVARTLNGEAGIQGKKGVLFWQIIDIVKMNKPSFILLENVDRLLKSPSKQRGKDFAVMLASFRDLGYSVEWRIINAADYGMAQKRRRVFIFAYKNETQFGAKQTRYSPQELIHEKGFFASEFPLEGTSLKHSASDDTLPLDIVEVSDTFTANFRNSGIMRNGNFYTEEVIPKTVPSKTLGQVLREAKEYGQVIDESYYLDIDKVGKNGKTALEHFGYLKGSKKIERTSETGHVYTYSEGSMNFPDDLNSPGRTMLTSEGTKNRSTHVVKDLDTGRLRILTPIECEILNDFPPNWTSNMPERIRYFCMGNALVVGLIEKMGNKIKEIYMEETQLLSIKEHYEGEINKLVKQQETVTKRIGLLKQEMVEKGFTKPSKVEAEKKLEVRV